MSNNKEINTDDIAYDNCVYEEEAIINYLRKYHTTPKQEKKKLQNNQEVEQMIQMLFDHHHFELRFSHVPRMCNVINSVLSYPTRSKTGECFSVFQFFVRF